MLEIERLPRSISFAVVPLVATMTNHANAQVPLGHVPRHVQVAQRQHLPPMPLAGSWIPGHEGRDEETP